MEITMSSPSKRFSHAHFGNDSHPCLPAKKRVYAPPPSEPAAATCLPAKKRACAPPPGVEASVCLPAKKRVYAPPLVSVCLPAKKRVWALAASGEAKEQEPKNSGKAVEFEVAKDQDSKKADNAIEPEEPQKAIDPLEAKDQECKKEVAEGEEDDGVLCSVCRSTDGDPSDPIVFCDGCDLMVHASCYGNPLVQSIPGGDWFCSLCESSAAAAAGGGCCLCPAKGGAMKRTTDGRWAHIACALLVPEVFFRDPDGRDAIDCSRVPGERFLMECYICRSSRGCALECSERKCGLGFHVSCGLDRGLCIEYREAKGSAAVVAGFCGDHSKLWEKQQLTGKYKIVARSA